MRFDDMLSTLLLRPADDVAARAAQWRQIVDVIGQRNEGGNFAELDAAYDLLRHMRAEVPVRARAEAAMEIAGRRVPPELVALFAEEAPAIAGPVIGQAVLESDEWIALLPALGPTARGVLRHRRDLPPEVMMALGSFGSSDFVIPGPAATESDTALELMPSLVPEMTGSNDQEDADLAAQDASTEEAAPATAQGESQIRDLLSRIEAFRGRMRDTEASVDEPLPAVDRVENFRFETGSDGLINWVEGAPRGPIIGETLAVAAASVDHGVDGQAAGAFRQRSPFRDARLTIGGEGAAAGEWRISGVPFFAPADGRFIGYRATARRPRPDETAVSGGGRGLLDSSIPPDSLRQLVHELRAPLNAVVGFSELIEQQYMGPAASAYRNKATDIIGQARRLLGAIDDLDLAARLERQIATSASGPIDAGELLMRIRQDYAPIAAGRGVRLSAVVAPDLPPIGGDAVAVERMVSRLIAAIVAVSDTGEAIIVGLDRAAGERPTLMLDISRPAQLAGRDEHMLLDPSFATVEGWGDEEWPDAPVLGLGFALRLVRNLAASIGGRLEINDTHFRLVMPIATTTIGAREGGA